MSNWSKHERFHALLSNELADRPIVSGWRHFIDKEQNAEDLAEITIQFTKQYDWDWVKINPRATYLAEVWGNQYDFQTYQTVFPKQLTTVLPTASDVWTLEEKKALESPPLQEQLAAVHKIRKELPDTPLTQTIFSPLSVLLFIAGQSPYSYSTVFGINNPVSLESLFVENRAGVHHALHQIALTLANYVTELELAGIDGIFYAVTGTANPHFIDEALFNEFSRPYDSIVLDAVKRGKTIFHTCGPFASPERFNDYPIDGISWDTVAEGNPDLSVELKATKVAGVDHHLFAENHVNKITNNTLQALKAMEGNPFLLAPNCAIPLTVTDEALLAFRHSINKKEQIK